MHPSVVILLVVCGVVQVLSQSYQPQPQVLSYKPAAQGLQELRQQQQYIIARAQQLQQRPAVFDNAEGLSQYSTQQPHRQTVLVPVDRQVQRTVQINPAYLQQFQHQQQQQRAPQELLGSQQQRKLVQHQLKQLQHVSVQAQPQPQPQIQYAQPQEQHRQEPVRYVRPVELQVQYRPRPHPRPQPQEEEREKDDYDPNPSYQFGFDVKDDLYTNYQNRKEQREGNKITGSYSVVDSDGFVRTVTYTADPKEGFKAEVSRQPTDIVVKIPKPLPQFQQQKAAPQYY